MFVVFAESQQKKTATFLAVSSLILHECLPGWFCPLQITTANMSQEKPAKLKLKRKKHYFQVAKDGRDPGGGDTGAPGESSAPGRPSCRDTGEGGPAAASGNHFSTRTDLWWEKDDLGETEKLWAFLLKSAFPDLRREGWETVPDFPSSVPQRYPKEQRSKWKTCERLSEECSAFPSVPQPDARTDVDADPCAKPVEQVQASVEEEMVVQHGSHQLNRSREKHAKEPPSTLEGTALRNNETCKSNHRNETGQQHLHKPSPSSRPTGGRPQSASTDRARAATEAGAQRRREENSTAGPCLLEKAQNGEVKEDLIKRKLPAHGERDFDSCIMTEETALAKCPTEEGCYKAAQCKKDNASNNGSADGNSGGGAIIQSCPMCLVPFPAGFTQMDCDSHLAQCLSEMNEDITW